VYHWCISVNLFTIPPAGPPSPPRAPRRRGVRRAVQVDHVYARRRVELHVEARAAPFLPSRLNHEFLPHVKVSSMSLALHTIFLSIDAKI